MRVVTVDEMRRIEAESEARGVSTAQLMENAGLAVAEQARDALGDLKSEHVVVLVGPGNNGGDGLVAARHLDDWGARVHVYVCGERPANDPHLETLRDRVADVREIRTDAPSAELRRALDNAAMAIDAMLGTGRSRPLQGPIAAACGALTEAKAARRGPFILALDVPTGLDADTGAVDPATPAAEATVALGYPKVGLFLFPRRRARGTSFRSGHRHPRRPRRGCRPGGRLPRLGRRAAARPPDLGQQGLLRQDTHRRGFGELHRGGQPCLCRGRALRRGPGHFGRAAQPHPRGRRGFA